MKIFLIVLLVVMLIASVPALRERAAPVIEPVAGAMYDVAAPLVTDLRDRFYGWDTRKELRGFSIVLTQVSIARQPMPHPARFTKWVVENTTSDGFDRWGAPYYFVIIGDSIIVGSSGPDKEQGNVDDIREGFLRSRT